MEPFGGQIVTKGKSRSSMGWVVIDVAIGLFCHSRYDLPIRNPAPMKPRTTTRDQRTFAVFVWRKHLVHMLSFI